jgi:hypothetical protein
MAGLAKMSITPTKPLSNTTTKFTFELNEIFSMLRTILYRYFTAIWTDKLLSLKTSPSISFVHSCHTVFSASEISSLALEA